MADKLTPAEAEKEFWNSLKESNTGMLGLDQAGYHHQPMTGFGEPETGTIWFFSRNDTDFARDVAVGGQQGMFCYQAKDGKVQACIHGDLSIDQDRARIDKYWNPVVAAWYPEGKDDPHLTLIRLDAEDGLRRAYFAYNHSVAYVDAVLGFARLYERSVALPGAPA